MCAHGPEVPAARADVLQPKKAMSNVDMFEVSAIKSFDTISSVNLQPDKIPKGVFGYCNDIVL